MVRKTRAQSAKATGKSASNPETKPIDYVDTQLQEITAYFEARSASGGLIDITKDVGDKIDKVVGYCKRTQENVKQPSIESLVSCLPVECARDNLSSEAFDCLLSLFLMSEPCQQRTHGFNLLLNIARHTDCTSTTGWGSSDKQTGSKKGVTHVTVIESLQKRFQDESDNGEILGILAELLTAVSSTPLGLTTDSPLDVRILPSSHRCLTAEPGIQNKRKRDEIQDSLEEPSMLDMPSDTHLESLDGRPSNAEAAIIKPVEKGLVTHTEIGSNPDGNQERSCKRLKRVTEAGSPIPVNTSSKAITALTRGHLLETPRQGQSSKRSVEEEAQVANEQPGLQGNNNYLLKSNLSTPIILQDKKNSCHELTKQATQVDIPKKGERLEEHKPFEEQSPTLRSPRRFSALESASTHTDQALFDQYLDLERGMVIMAQPPENIFSSPQRRTLIEEPKESPIATRKPIPKTGSRLIAELSQAQNVASTSKPWTAQEPLPGKEARLDLHLMKKISSTSTADRSFPLPSNNLLGYLTQDFSNPIAPLALVSNVELQEAKTLLAPPIASDRDANNLEARPLADEYLDATLYQNAGREIQTSLTFPKVALPTSTLGNIRTERAETDPTSTSNRGENEPTSAPVIPIDASTNAILSSELQILIAHEVDRAFKGLGAYLYNTSYQDLVSQHNRPGEEEEALRINLMNSASRRSVIKDSSITLVPPSRSHDTNAACRTVPLTSSTIRHQAPELQTQSDPSEVFSRNSNALHSTKAYPEMVSSSTTASIHSSSANTAIPNTVSAQILEQVQGLRPDIVPPFLTALTLLTNVFQALDDSEETLMKAMQEYDRNNTKRTLNRLKTRFDMEYQQKSMPLLSRIKATVGELGKFHASCGHQARTIPVQDGEHTKGVVEMVDVAIKGMPV